MSSLPASASSVPAILRLIGARARRRPGRALFTAIGLAVATAFAGGVAAQATIAGDRAAHAVLSQLSPLDRTVRLTYSDIVNPGVERRAHALLSDLGLGAQSEVLLLNPVRLSGVVVRPAAIDPLRGWTTTPIALGACRPIACPMRSASGRVGRGALTAAGVRISIGGTVALRSAAPLGFTPTQPADQPPVVLTGDVHGLEAMPGLSGVYRTHSWLALLPSAGQHAWQLAAAERRLRGAQATLLASASGFSMTAPFDGLDAARAQAGAAPRRLLLAGGGAIAALVLFVVLAAGALRRDVEDELTRLRNAGATARQCVLFVSAEAALLCGASLALGALLALATGAIEADAAGVPVAGVLTHSLITATGAAALLAGWLCASVLIASLLLLRSGRIADLLSVGAVAALALALIRGASAGNDPLGVLLAPLACLAGGVLVYRAAAVLLRAGERLARGGPVMARLAFVGLARAPSAPSLAIAFVAVSVGLGGFALAYRATLVRSTADQAADRVPLDARIAPGADFTTPLQVAPLARWQAIARGSVSPVRRTEASYVSGGSSLTVPALGVPAGALTQLHGWRTSDASTPIGALAHRLVPPGPARVPGPPLAPTGDLISLPVQARGVGVTITADLRDSDGTVRRVRVGQASGVRQTLRARLPGRGGWELQALELSEPTGLQITSGHQNAENVAADTRFTGIVQLGPMSIGGRAVGIAGWRAIGAASGGRRDGEGLLLRFAASGELGLVRPPQPSDARPVPMLADPQTAATSGKGRRLALTVDGVPITARVVGVLRRFPTVAAGSSGFVVADETTLASALDAQAPGQGRPDELWISTKDVAGLRGAMNGGDFAQLATSFRLDVQHRLRAAPIASAVLGTLVAATAVSAMLAILGLIVALLGAARDERIERDLIVQGVGPGALRTELRLRLSLAGGLGVCAGLGIGAVLTRLALAAVRGAGTVAVPRPPIVMVAPWAELALWGLGAAAALIGAAWLATRTLVGRPTS